MPLIAGAYSSLNRPVLHGTLGAVSAAHPLAVAAGQEILVAGGSAVDAMIAAQAVLCVVAPNACGLGGDMFCLVHAAGEAPVAVNGAGAAPMALVEVSVDGANSITVPGIVSAWDSLSRRWRRLSLARALTPAIRIARGGYRIDGNLLAAVEGHRARLLAGGAGAWALLGLRQGDRFIQPELASLLEAIGLRGRAAFYAGDVAAAVASAVGALGGTLSAADLAAHETVLRPPVMTRWGDVTIATQPPMAQGVLLSMALDCLGRLESLPAEARDHAGIEVTEAAFAYRSRVGEGEELLAIELGIDIAHAQRRGGPRAYLHTAGVAVSDATGLTVSSLVSVFDEFGSCVFVPECGLTLNDRAGGFTDGRNTAGPGRIPVHTLAPAMVLTERGTLALATPGADGQVQTLLQVITGIFRDGLDIAAAVRKPRWRSEGGAVLIERGHPACDDLARRGHILRVLEEGDTRFGAIVCAGAIDGGPIALSDWRRDTWSGVA
jgi:gamma-glutamyltranspeptidase / glutathione hydrolase